MKLAITLALALTFVAGAHAQAVWRCGADSLVYTDKACDDGGRQVAVADVRTAAELRFALAVAAREKRLAEKLAAEARQREAAAAGSGLAGIRSPAVLVPRSADKPQRAKAAPFTVKLARSAA